MPIIQFAHANGFSSKTYSTFYKYLTPDFEIATVDRFGHGEAKIKSNWFPMLDQLFNSLEQHKGQPVIGLGHSLGGILTFWAAQQRPELFEKIILMEPPMFKPWTRNLIRWSQALGVGNKTIPPAKKALRRRRHFENKEQAYTYFRDKRLFRVFDERCFQDCIDYGLVEEKNGVGLYFSADVEYDIFLHMPTRFKWKLKVPAYFIYSGKYEVLSKQDIQALEKRLPQMKFIQYEKGGHMFPMEWPEETANLIREIVKL